MKHRQIHHVKHCLFSTSNATFAMKIVVLQRDVSPRPSNTGNNEPKAPIVRGTLLFVSTKMSEAAASSPSVESAGSAQTTPITSDQPKSGAGAGVVVDEKDADSKIADQQKGVHFMLVLFHLCSKRSRPGDVGSRFFR